MNYIYASLITLAILFILYVFLALVMDMGISSGTMFVVIVLSQAGLFMLPAIGGDAQ